MTRKNEIDYDEHSRTIWLYDDISSDNILKYIQALNELSILCLSEDRFQLPIGFTLTNEQEKKAYNNVCELNKIFNKITIRINSNGGEAEAAFNLIDNIRTCSVPVDVIIEGKAFSSAAAVAICTTGNRFILQNSFIMLHSIQFEGEEGSFTSQQRHNENVYVEAMTNKLCKLISQRSKKTEKYIRKILNENKDFYFSAEECLTNGFCDYII